MRCLCQVSRLHSQKLESREQKTTEYNYLLKIDTFPWNHRGNPHRVDFTSDWRHFLVVREVAVLGLSC